MMEGPAVSAQATNGMYVPNAQQHSPLNGSVGPMQYGATPASQKSEDLETKSLYVGNLDPRITEPVLAEVFSAVRPVVAVKIIPDKRQVHGGLNYGFVEFGSHQDAEVALQNMNGRSVYEYEIRVNWAFTSNGGQLQEDTSTHCHIFVGDLSAEVNDQVLSKAFENYPSMSDARVMWDMTSGKSRGYGFVTFRDRNDADMAIAQMNGEWLGSRAIRVNWANQKASSKARQDMHQQPHSVAGTLSYEDVRDQTAHYKSTVYVGNLTNYTTQDQLQGLFQGYGYVVEFRMQSDRGFAFVKMDTHENAAMAITQLNGAMINGRPLKCSWGKDRLMDPKAAFGAIAAAAAANPAYTYPYAYGMAPQQYGVPQQAGINGQQQQQQVQQQVGAQGWGPFGGYESYAYYGNPNYAQPGQMMPQQQQQQGVIGSSVVSGVMPGAGSSVSQASPDSNHY
ncbi:E3 ubiquitin-protein ligase pub1 [Kickxella alabastrina]|nr:E3 ubiquitin-protein ligase pub1 [Kickxella alabastrina]